MIIVGFIFIILLIFPIFVRLELYFSNTTNKLYFCFKIFSIIKLLFGEITTNGNGIIINLNYKKLIIYKYKNFLNIKDKIKPLRDYHLLKCKTYLNIGVKNFENSVIIASFFLTITELINMSIKELKPYIKFKNNLNIYEDSDDKNAFASLNFVFNLLTVLLGLLKKLWGKLLIWKEKVTG